MPKKGRYTTLTSWSYSVYSTYLGCPFAVCLDKIQKIRIKEPDNPHFVRGDRVHKGAEAFIAGSGKAPKLEPELEKLKPLLTAYRKAKARVELEWAFTRTWLPTGWFDKDAWLRVKTDVCADTTDPPTVAITDWKTGKVYPDHRQQRSLYALGGLQLVQIGALAGGSKNTKLTAQHIYVDTGFTATEKYAMKDLDPLKREWTARTKDMLNDTVFEPTPGQACKWCRFGKSKGGPCESEKR